MKVEYIYLILALILNAGGNVLMKVGAKDIISFKTLNFLEAIAKNYILIIGLALFAFNVIFYILALSKINLSIAYPVMVGGGFLLISLTSFLYLKESISLLQIIGIIMVFSGIILFFLNSK
ncbi:hypothetical protein A2272_00505 [Candidatus Peregrinibacteria bacterium RIFOXYA12_FULL_33_12]|nr:MAG: hypothetical protein A2272_00505 [Candidatus Peregrinibacteria bacterium RIFOXYA12_FULL_33_12]